MLTSVARREQRLEKSNMRMLALEQTEELIARDLGEIDSNLFVVRALLKRNEFLKSRVQRTRTVAGELESRGRHGRRAA